MQARFRPERSCLIEAGRGPPRNSPASVRVERTWSITPQSRALSALMKPVDTRPTLGVLAGLDPAIHENTVILI